MTHTEILRTFNARITALYGRVEHHIPDLTAVCMVGGGQSADEIASALTDGTELDDLIEVVEAVIAAVEAERERHSNDSPGCDSCRQWALLKAQKGLPTSGDTYCAECGAREADVSKAVKTSLRKPGAYRKDQ